MGTKRLAFGKLGKWQEREPTQHSLQKPKREKKKRMGEKGKVNGKGRGGEPNFKVSNGAHAGTQGGVVWLGEEIEGEGK